MGSVLSGADHGVVSARVEPGGYLSRAVLGIRRLRLHRHNLHTSRQKHTAGGSLEAIFLLDMNILNRQSSKPMSSISVFKNASAQSEKENNRIVKMPRITVLHRTSLAPQLLYRTYDDRMCC